MFIENDTNNPAGDGTGGNKTPETIEIQGQSYEVSKEGLEKLGQNYAGAVNKMHTATTGAKKEVKEQVEKLETKIEELEVKLADKGEGDEIYDVEAAIKENRAELKKLNKRLEGSEKARDEDKASSGRERDQSMANGLEVVDPKIRTDKKLQDEVMDELNLYKNAQDCVKKLIKNYPFMKKIVGDNYYVAAYYLLNTDKVSKIKKDIENKNFTETGGSGNAPSSDSEMTDKEWNNKSTAEQDDILRQREKERFEKFKG